MLLGIGRYMRNESQETREGGSVSPRATLSSLNRSLVLSSK